MGTKRKVRPWLREWSVSLAAACRTEAESLVRELKSLLGQPEGWLEPGWWQCGWKGAPNLGAYFEDEAAKTC